MYLSLVLNGEDDTNDSAAKGREKKQTRNHMIKMERLNKIRRCSHST